MKELKADLHVHTCLSPCAEPEMVPTAIVKRAKMLGLDMIAICDHNSSDNAAAVIKAGERESITVIGGIEMTSREEVHVLGLFANERDLQRVQKIVNENLAGTNDEQVFGPQTIVDDHDRVLGANERLLSSATRLSLDAVVEAIHDCGGLAIASHIDRPSFGLVGQLGFIPKGLKLDALEASPRSAIVGWDDFSVVTSSDAHTLNDIGRYRTAFFVAEPSFAEIRKALWQEDGRRVSIHMEDLSLHILDIVENSIGASASKIEILLAEDTKQDQLCLQITDNGQGMDAQACKQALDPFFTTRTTRRVGMGLPLLAQAAKESGGSLDLTSEPGRGTTIKAAFQLSHPDLKPLGDIAETLRTIVSGRPDLDLRFEYIKDSKCVAALGGSQNHDKE